jgi:hypothetical protein
LRRRCHRRDGQRARDGHTSNNGRTNMRAHIDPYAVVFAVRTGDTIRTAEEFDSDQGLLTALRR